MDRLYFDFKEEEDDYYYDDYNTNMFNINICDYFCKCSILEASLYFIRLIL